MLRTSTSRNPAVRGTFGRRMTKLSSPYPACPRTAHPSKPQSANTWDSSEPMATSDSQSRTSKLIEHRAVFGSSGIRTASPRCVHCPGADTAPRPICRARPAWRLWVSGGVSLGQVHAPQYHQRSQLATRLGHIADSVVGGIGALVLLLTFLVFIPQGVTSDGNKLEGDLGSLYAGADADTHQVSGAP